MKKLTAAWFLALCLACFAGTAAAADVVITSVGQTSDGMMAKMLMKKLNVEPEYAALLDPAALDGQKVLIAVVGGSSKGLGAAGIDREQEKARGVTLLEEAKKKGIKVLVMHIGGERRRGDLTDMFIEAVTGLGDKVIVVKSGNADGIFSKSKAADAELVEVDTVQATVEPLKAAFAAWGVEK
jgi:hypothetical protein